MIPIGQGTRREDEHDRGKTAGVVCSLRHHRVPHRCDHRCREQEEEKRIPTRDSKLRRDRQPAEEYTWGVRSELAEREQQQNQRREGKRRAEPVLSSPRDAEPEPTRRPSRSRSRERPDVVCVFVPGISLSLQTKPSILIGIEKRVEQHVSSHRVRPGRNRPHVDDPCVSDEGGTGSSFGAAKRKASAPTVATSASGRQSRRRTLEASEKQPVPTPS